MKDEADPGAFPAEDPDGDAPVLTAHDADGESGVGDAAWKSRPYAARLLRFGVLAVPFTAVIYGAWLINSVLGPTTGLAEAMARWSALSVLSTLVLLGIDRGARRMLPLAMLLHLSIVFPDDAPSRFKVALKRGSTRQLERDAAAHQLDDATPQEAAEYLLSVVADLSTHDRRTRGHTERVRAYADMVAEEMGLSEQEREKLHWAGLIHDVGKMSVPADILNKQTRLSDREWARLRTHPNEGWKLVQPLRPWLGEWTRATRDHHERWDGGGYPRGLRGHEISRAGRIVAVVDAFDVMTTRRSYSEPMTFDEARAELSRCAGTQFDPEVVRAFLSLSLSGKRRTGPLTWLANSPIAMQITSVTQAPAIAASTLAAAIAAATVVVPAFDEVPGEIVAERIVEDDAVPTTFPPSTTVTTTLAPTTTPAPTSSTTTSTTTTTTATPTTAAPPPPPTTTTTTTTTLPPSRFEGGFLGGGAGFPTYDMVDAVAGSGAINWDSDVNDDPGLTMSPDPDGLIEISAASVKAWRMTAAEDLTLSGRGSLRLFVAVADFDTEAFGGMLGGFVTCADGVTVCTTLGRGSAVFAQSSFGAGFGELRIDLGRIEATVPAGNSLIASLAVPASVGTDIWVAFGTTSYPAAFRLE